VLHSSLALRTAFDYLGTEYIDFAAGLTHDELEQPGLGEWNVRELLAHALRAFGLAGAYLDAKPSTDFIIHSSGEYYRAVLGMGPNLHADVAERGRVAAEGLRSDVAGVVRSTVEAACARVGLADDNAMVSTPAAQMSLLAYLPTRIVEGAVHLLDLHEALSRELDLDPVVAEIVLLTLVEIGDARQVIRALTGRRDLPVGFNVLR
jgi:hypothetical protein